MGQENMFKLKAVQGEGKGHAPVDRALLAELLRHATVFRGGYQGSEKMDPTRWQIVGEYEGRAGLLWYVNPPQEGASPEFIAQKIAQLINESGGHVEAWGPTEEKK